MFSEGIRQDFLQPQVHKPSATPAVSVRTTPVPERTGFGSVLQEQLQQLPNVPLTFSGHALQRMQQRQIALTQQEHKALSDACAKARQKGAKETLILADKAAFVVSVSNSTVITVLDKENLKDNLFTQIDSAIII